MKINFETALKHTLKWEGGYSNHPADPGGATYKGVIQRVYNSYRRLKGQTPRSVKLLSNDELEDIYKTNYWDAVKGDQLPSGLDLAVFDYGVNSGPSRAIKGLQKAINKVGARSLSVDGQFGPATLDGATSYPAANLIDAVCTERLGFVRRIKNFPVFGKGWVSRIEGIRNQSQAIVSSAPQQHRPEVPPELGTAGDKKPVEPGVVSIITGILGTAGASILTALNNPYALVFALAVLGGVGYLLYRRYLR